MVFGCFLLHFFPLNSQTNSIIPDMICRFVLFSPLCFFFGLSLKYIHKYNGFLYSICIRPLALYFYSTACLFRHLLAKSPSFRHLYLFVLRDSIINLLLYNLELIWIVDKLCQFLPFTFPEAVIVCLWCHKCHKRKHLKNSFQEVCQMNTNIICIFKEVTGLTVWFIFMACSVLVFSLQCAERTVFMSQ